MVKVYIKMTLAVLLLMTLSSDMALSTLGMTDNMNKMIIDVPYIDQTDITYGCEAVSSTMLLNYYGYDIDKKDFTDNYLIKRDWIIDANNTILGPDPHSAYVGNPYIQEKENCGFGCYAGVVAKSMDKLLVDEHKTKITTGIDLDQLIEEYIKNDIPVLVWATINMQESSAGMSWIINYIDENSPYNIGDEFTWIAGEHCLVLVGYDKENYYFNDPYENKGVIGYEKELVRSRFDELGRQSLVIVSKN